MTLHVVLFYLLATLTAVSAIGVVVSQNIVRAATWLLFALAGTAGVFFLLGADFLGATQLLIYVGGTLVLVVFGVMLTAQGPFINMRIGVAEWAIAVAVGLTLYGVLAVALVTFAPVLPETKRQEAEKELAQQVRKALDEAQNTERFPPVSDIRKAGLELITQHHVPRQQVIALIRDEQQRWLKEEPGDKNPLVQRSLETVVGLDLPASKHLGAALLGDLRSTPDALLTGTPLKRERSKMAYLLPFEIVSVHLLVVLVGAAYLARAKRRKGASS